MRFFKKSIFIWFLVVLSVIIVSGLFVMTFLTKRVSGRKNVILMIPDGMSVSLLTAARIVSVGVEGRLNMDILPEYCRMTTYSVDSMITDSKAAGTAMATGQKTKQGIISEDSTVIRGRTHGAPLKTILELAEEAGLATGLVTTARVTHSTPSPFYAHWYEGEDDNTIATQILDKEIEVILGGGRRHLLPKGRKDPESQKLSKRKDDKDIIAEAQAKGYTYVWKLSDFRAIDLQKTDKLFGIFNWNHMEYEYDRKNDVAGEPSLAEMTEKTIELLKKNPKGFFLMVEGARIDHAGHMNDAQRAIYDTIAFDKAVGVARKFAESNGNTLIIVASDHDCGGPAIIGWYNDKETITTYEGFTDYQDTDNDGYPDNQPIRPIAIGWASSRFFLTKGVEIKAGGDHTGKDVPVMAMGPNSENLEGLIDNTYLFKVMAFTLGVGGITELKK